MTERQNIEWKENWRDDYLQWICAFANTEGGMLVIGKHDKGHIVGVRRSKKLLEDIPSKIKAHLGIIASVNLRAEGELEFIEIVTQPYSNPISYKGKYYIRSGSTTHELNGPDLTDFLLKKSGKTWDEIIVEDATIDDIDTSAIQKMIADSSDNGRLPDTTGLSDIQILEKLHLVRGEKIKRSAIILFGKDPNHYFTNIQIKIGRFGEDTEDLKFHEIIEGNLIYSLEEVKRQLNHKFLKRPIHFEGMMRIEEDEYPLAALREILLNALVHKRYGGAAIQIRVFDNQITVWNEGKLPADWTEEVLLGPHNSIPPNPLVANACFMAGYIDAWGRGTIKILKACEEAGFPKPRVRVKDGGIEWTMWNKNVWQTEDGEASEAVGGQPGRSATDQVTDQVGQTINEKVEEVVGVTGDDSKRARLIQVVLFVWESRNVKISDIMSKFGVSESTARKDIKILNDGGLINYLGSRKKGFYDVSEELRDLIDPETG